jgi:hypothetical protein
MENMFGLLSGVVFKVYDDIQDNKIPLDPSYTELLKVLVVCIFTIMFMSDIGVSFLYIIICGYCWLVNQVDSVFWKSCLVIPVLTTLANLSKIQYGGIFDIFQRIIFTVIIGIFIFFEDRSFPEEFSERKLMFRSSVSLILLLVIPMTASLSAGKTITLLLLSGLGYCVTSVLTNFHKLYDVTLVEE